VAVAVADPAWAVADRKAAADPAVAVAVADPALAVADRKAADRRAAVAALASKAADRSKAVKARSFVTEGLTN